MGAASKDGTSFGAVRSLLCGLCLWQGGEPSSEFYHTNVNYLRKKFISRKRYKKSRRKINVKKNVNFQLHALCKNEIHTKKSQNKNNFLPPALCCKATCPTPPNTPRN